MQKKNQKTVNEFLASAETISDDVLEDMTTMLGSKPFIFPVLRERADTFALSMLADYHVFRPKHLPAKMAELSAVAAAAGAGADKCLKVHIQCSHKGGCDPGRDLRCPHDCGDHWKDQGLCICPPAVVRYVPRVRSGEESGYCRSFEKACPGQKKGSRCKAPVILSCPGSGGERKTSPIF